MKRYLILASLMIAAMACHADTALGTITDKHWQPIRGSTNVGTPVATEAECWIALRAWSEANKLSITTAKCRNEKVAKITYSAPVPPPPTGGTAQTIEAESGTIGGGADIQTLGYASGGKLVGLYGGTGRYVEWSIDAGAGGAWTFSARYDNATGRANVLGLWVNGTKVADVQAPVTGASWGALLKDTAAVPIALVAGANRVRLQIDLAPDQPTDIDRVTLTPGGSAPPPPPPPPPPPATTGTATLQWDASPDPRVIAYRVYWGTAPRTYSQALGAGVLVTGTSHTVPALASGATYYFAVTAVGDGQESGYSNEASKAFP